MFSIENKVGRLVEVRIATPVREEEMPGIGKATHDLIASIPDEFVAVMDLRAAHVFPQTVSDAFVEILSDNNPKLQRSAFLIGESAIFGLQVERAIRQAGKPTRRAFRDPAEMEAWLDEPLAPAEQRRLHDFLAESPQGADAELEEAGVGA